MTTDNNLKERYPKMGVSPRNLWYMKKFYERYAEHGEKVQRSVSLLPWSHNMLLLSKGLDDDATLYYATKTVEKGWNRTRRYGLAYRNGGLSTDSAERKITESTC